MSSASKGMLFQFLAPWILSEASLSEHRMPLKSSTFVKPAFQPSVQHFSFRLCSNLNRSSEAEHRDPLINCAKPNPVVPDGPRSSHERGQSNYFKLATAMNSLYSGGRAPNPPR